MSLWLARIRMDRRNRAANNDLSDIVNLHNRVMKMFPDGIGDDARRQAGVLFRIDETPTGPEVLVQARMEPSPARLPDGYGTFELRKLQPLLDAITTGMVVRYRLAGNASKRLAKDEPPQEQLAEGERPKYRKGQVVALNGRLADEWWERRARAAGLAVLTGESQPVRASAGERRDGRKVCHAITRFDGVAVVGDADAVRRAVVAGIGKGKAYGCGLLSLAPVRQV